MPQHILIYGRSAIGKTTFIQGLRGMNMFDAIFYEGNSKEIFSFDVQKLPSTYDIIFWLVDEHCDADTLKKLNNMSVTKPVTIRIKKRS